jgi:hypothetical protein
MTTGIECVWCDEAAVDGHHLTGRGPDRRYLNPDLVASMCHDDHELAHEDLRNAGVDTPPRGAWSSLRGVEFCLERAALFLARLAQQSQQNVWGRLADAMRRWAEDLRAHRHWLDQALPGWELAAAAEVTP